ncbi:uncharacterized protein PSFLO_02513 [Pseudozyma flocculosa]|nr:uncharacterized protein PSFLO_02513 [Pseudozyma flocculosa]
MSNTSHVAPVDLDSWNISLFPEDLLGLLTPETPLELVSHSSVSILKDDPFFKDWVFAGDIHGHIRIHPSYKAPLVQSLQGNNLALEISPFPTALIKGNQHISINTFVNALHAIGCTHIRVNAYGWKETLDIPGTRPLSYGNPLHPHAHLNTFDLGTHYHSSAITLLSPRHKDPRIKVYPLLTPIGKGFGTINMSITMGSLPFTVKAYSRLAHRIKANTSHQMITKPTTIFAARRRSRQAQEIFTTLSQKTERELGGLRMEATVTAPTLQQAITILSSTPLLNLHAFLDPVLEELKPFQLRQHHVFKPGYIKNCQMLFQAAEMAQIFHGRNTSPATKEMQQAVVDLLNALGWNNGRHKPTKHSAQHPWWQSIQQTAQGSPQPSPPPAAPPVISLDHVQGKAAMTKLFLAIRSQLHCSNCSHPSPSFYLDGGNRQYRICCRECRVTLGQQKTRDMVAPLITSGVITVDLPSLGLAPPPPPLQAPPPREAPGMEVPPPAPEDSEATGTPPPPPRTSRASKRRKAAPVTMHHQPRRSARLRAKAITTATTTAAKGQPSFTHGRDPFVEIILAPSSTTRRQASSPSPAASPATTPPVSPPATTRAVTFTASAKAGPPPALVKPAADVGRAHRFTGVPRTRITQVVQGDGNCLFRAMSLLIQGSASFHYIVHRAALEWLFGLQGVLRNKPSRAA